MPRLSQRFWGVFLHLSFSIFLSAWAYPLRAAEIKRLMVITPLYREFQSGNLSRLLNSFLDQDDLSKLEGLDLIFVVNENWGASPATRHDNLLAFQFLSALARSEERDLSEVSELEARRLAQRIRSSSKIKIHVIDARGGLPFEVNIGALRARGNDYALELAKDSLSSTLIAQFDADSRVSPNFARVLQLTFSREPLDYALAYLDFDLDPESAVQSCHKFAKYRMTLATDHLAYEILGNTEAFGTPRIITRADKLLAVGGMPHLAVGEDGALLRALSQRRFSSRYLPQLRVTTGYRAREDGYDSAQHHQSLNQPLDIDPIIAGRIEAVGDFESLLREFVPDLLPEFLRLRSDELNKLRKQISNRRRDLMHLLTHPKASLAWHRDPFFSMKWLQNLLSAVRADPQSGNVNDAFNELENLLPQFIGNGRLSQAQENFALLQATSQTVATLRMRINMYSPRPPNYQHLRSRMIEEWASINAAIRTSKRPRDIFRRGLLGLIQSSWRDSFLQSELEKITFEGPIEMVSADQHPAADVFPGWPRASAWVRGIQQALCEAAANWSPKNRSR